PQSIGLELDPADGAKVLELKSRHAGTVLAGAGLHPSRVPELSDEEAAAELKLVAQRAATADFIGEIGLDYRDAPDAPQQRRQREILERLLDIAEHARLPVNMHTRRADRELVEIARTFTLRTGLGANLHWFTHSKKLAWRCAESGIYISAGPSIETDPLQLDVARGIAADFLLVETDSPVEYGGAVASPSWAPRVASLLADERGDEADAFAFRLAQNLSSYLGLDVAG
ncbi:MAG TPA: TatD family hydrolase, partial [Candidatus Saccharimonadales bacterium]|nr:TatD family hydrolase [Candidatus Saccharimonadales bacterium]